jgi:hypothetical protein
MITALYAGIVLAAGGQVFRGIGDLVDVLRERRAARAWSRAG